jgi:hypothetical protein
MTWDRDWIYNWHLPLVSPEKDKVIGSDSAMGRLEKNFPGDRPWLLLGGQELSHPEAHGYRLAFHTTAQVCIVVDETYYLYEPLPVNTSK